MKKKFAIDYVFRKKLDGKNSIEEIFYNISLSLEAMGIKVDNISLPSHGVNLKSIFENYRALKRLQSDIIHITGDVHYTALFCNKPTVLTIHDVKSILKGNYLKIFILKLFWFWLPALRVSKITVISEFSKQEVCDVIPFAKNKITVIHNPINTNLVRANKNFNEKKPKILHLGTKANKNLLRTIEAISTLDCQLIIIGKLSKEYTNRLNNLNIDYVNEFNISYERIVDHYINCDLVSFVSLYEGFGMPIIEAQHVGRPVITSNLASIPEIAGDGAHFVNPYNVHEINAGINRIIKEENYRNSLVNKGFDNVNRFKIDEIAKQYLGLYKEILR